MASTKDLIALQELCAEQFNIRLVAKCEDRLSVKILELISLAAVALNSAVINEQQQG